MEELTRRAEEMLDIINQMKVLDVQLQSLCTGECKKCPLTKECLGEAQFDLGMEFDIEKCADFINYHDKVTEQKERERLEAEADAKRETEAIREWEESHRWEGI